MPSFQVYNLGSLNLKVSPFNLVEGDVIRAVNIVKDQIGVLRKRPGYETFLSTANGSSPLDLWFWEQNEAKFLYRNGGGKLYYHDVDNGTAWVVSGNGTVNNNHMGHAVLDETMIVSQDAGTTRHTTDGSTLSDTALAPAGEIVFEAGRRGYIAAGTQSSLFFSTSNDISNWSTTGTSDSSSVFIPGAGRLQIGFQANDRAVVGKTGGAMFTWDTDFLRRVPTNRSFTSQWSLDTIEDFVLGLNRVGIFGFAGDRPIIVSNAIEKIIYNDAGTGIAGTAFESAVGKSYRNDYFLSVGDVTDDFTTDQITNALIKYDFQLNEYLMWSTAHKVTAMTPYKDANDTDQFLLGTSNGGQAYRLTSDSLTDAGTAIESIIEFVLYASRPAQEKFWQKIRLFANPGCEASVLVGLANTFTRSAIDWYQVGDMIDGFVEFDFPARARSRLLFVKLIDKSIASRFSFYGFEYICELIGDKS